MVPGCAAPCLNRSVRRSVPHTRARSHAHFLLFTLSLWSSFLCTFWKSLACLAPLLHQAHLAQPKQFSACPSGQPSIYSSQGSSASAPKDTRLVILAFPSKKSNVCFLWCCRDLVPRAIRTQYYAHIGSHIFRQWVWSSSHGMLDVECRGLGPCSSVVSPSQPRRCIAPRPAMYPPISGLPFRRRRRTGSKHTFNFSRVAACLCAATRPSMRSSVPSISAGRTIISRSTTTLLKLPSSSLSDSSICCHHHHHRESRLSRCGRAFSQTQAFRPNGIAAGTV